MKYAAILAALAALAAPAFAQPRFDCTNAVQLDAADLSKGGVIIITGPCASSGPAREVIHTARPGEPLVTTVVIRRAKNGASQSRQIKVADGQYFGASSQARIIRVPD